MAQINMKDTNKDAVNSAEIKKSEIVNKAEANEQPAELINNASEKAEDINEIKKEPKKEEAEAKSSKVVVTYIGNGIWKDSEGKLWAPTDKASSIKNERQYTAKEYEDRADLKFMVQYGSMKVTYVK